MERQRTDEELFSATPENCEKLQIPRMASQLLGWDPALRHEDIYHSDAVNFPGLCLAPDDDSFEIINKSRQDSDLSIFSSSISVLRSVVTTEEVTGKD